ncbi:MAG: hypothetical protein GY874_04165 [Desulfobacteraceae bacterium]|nr:hypothetical protein [Desulfobacteraceae bacterium]
MEKTFISNNDTATFVCPECGNVATVNVEQFAFIDKKVTVHCKCHCGNNFSVSLEKRRQYRKETDLPGVYYCRIDGGNIDKGIMRVVDISSKGLKLKLNVERNFKVGEPLKIEFHLNDKRRSFIQKDVVVRNVNKNIVGTSFSITEGDDPNLGFYLMS